MLQHLLNSNHTSACRRRIKNLLNISKLFLYWSRWKVSASVKAVDQVISIQCSIVAEMVLVLVNWDLSMIREGAKVLIWCFSSRCAAYLSQLGELERVRESFEIYWGHQIKSNLRYSKVSNVSRNVIRSIMFDDM